MWMLYIAATPALCQIVNFRLPPTPSLTRSCDWRTYHIPSSASESRSPTASSRSSSDYSRHRSDDRRVAARHPRDNAPPPVTTAATQSDRYPTTPTQTIEQRRQPGALPCPPSAANRHGSASEWNAPLRPLTVWNGPPVTSTSACWPRSRQRYQSPTDAAFYKYTAAVFHVEKVETPVTVTTSTHLRVDSLERDELASGLRIFSGLWTRRRTRLSCLVEKQLVENCGKTACN